MRATRQGSSHTERMAGMELSPKFIKLRNSAFNKRERDYIRLALLEMLNRWVQDGYSQDQIDRIEKLISKFNDGKNFK